MGGGWLNLFFYSVLIFMFLGIMEYEKGASGQIEFPRPGPLMSLKATAILTPCYLMSFPETATNLTPANQTFLYATALTILATPLLVPFLSVPEPFTHSFVTFAPTWLIITSLRLAVCYALEHAIEFVAHRIHAVDALLKLISAGFFTSPQSGNPLPEPVQALLLIGVVGRLMNIYRSRHPWAGIAMTPVIPFLLSYLNKVYSEAHLPPDVLEFAPKPGFWLGLFFLLATEYSLILQARPFEQQRRH